MPKLFSSDFILKILKKNGFVTISQKGSHLKLKNNSSPQKTVIVPSGKKEIPLGTFHSILRQSGLSKYDFEL